MQPSKIGLSDFVFYISITNVKNCLQKFFAIVPKEVLLNILPKRCFRLKKIKSIFLALKIHIVDVQSSE